MAHKVIVNSRFTAETFKKSFPLITRSLSKRPGGLEILYPCISSALIEAARDKINSPASRVKPPFIFLSVNRFERKKNLNLLVLAFSELKRRVSAETFRNSRLIIAGSSWTFLQV